MGRVPDAVQRSPGDAKHRPVTLLRRAGIHKTNSMGPGSAAHRYRAAQRPGHSTNKKGGPAAAPL
jgi:hypothetical protein